MIRWLEIVLGMAPYMIGGFLIGELLGFLLTGPKSLESTWIFLTISGVFVLLGALYFTYLWAKGYETYYAYREGDDLCIRSRKLPGEEVLFRVRARNPNEITACLDTGKILPP